MFERLSLNALKFFYFVAHYGSVTLAAEKLFVTQGAVSKQVKSLEDQLGIQLFERKNKSLRLTQSGQLLYQHCHQSFLLLDDGLLQLTAIQQQSHNLIVSCEPTLAMKWLIPRLNDFRKLQTGFDITLLSGGGNINFQQQRIDLAIRRNDFAIPEHLHQLHLADELTLLIRSHLTETTKNRLLLSSSRPELYKNRPHQHAAIKTYAQTEYMEHFYLCIEACLAGLGDSLVSGYMVERELQHRIFQIISPPVTDGSCYVLLSQSSFESDQRKQVFADWLAQQMQQSYQQITTQTS